MEREIAKALLEIKAVFLQPQDPFTWASGIKSPIYCDNRLILSYPEIRNQVKIGLSELVYTHFIGVQRIIGTATAGIAPAAIVADHLNLPMGYVRSANKSHGRQNLIEGIIHPGDKVVVIEDLISTGKSVLEVVDALKAIDVEVLGVVAIFTYGMDQAKTNFERANIPYIALTNFDILLEEAVHLGYITESEKQQCKTFQQNPSSSDWQTNHQ